MTGRKPSRGSDTYNYSTLKTIAFLENDLQLQRGHLNHEHVIFFPVCFHNHPIRPLHIKKEN